VTIYQVFALI